MSDRLQEELGSIFSEEGVDEEDLGKLWHSVPAGFDDTYFEKAGDLLLMTAEALFEDSKRLGSRLQARG